MILPLFVISEITSEGLSPVEVPSKTQTYCSKASEGPLIWLWLEHKTYEERIRNLALFYLEKEGSLKRLTAIFSFLMGGYRGEWWCNQRQQTQTGTCKIPIKD